MRSAGGQGRWSASARLVGARPSRGVQSPAPHRPRGGPSPCSKADGPALPSWSTSSSLDDMVPLDDIRSNFLKSPAQETGVRQPRPPGAGHGSAGPSPEPAHEESAAPRPGQPPGSQAPSPEPGLGSRLPSESDTVVGHDLCTWCPRPPAGGVFSGDCGALERPRPPPTRTGPAPLCSLPGAPLPGPPSSSGLPVASAPVASLARLPLRVRMTGDLEGQDRAPGSVSAPGPISVGGSPAAPGARRRPYQALAGTWGSKS